MQLKQKKQICRAILAAGFTLSNNRTFRTPEGTARLVTLSYGQTKLVTIKVLGEASVYECEFVHVSSASRKSQQDRINQFWSLPVVIELARDEKRGSANRAISMERLADTIYLFASISKEVHAHQMNAF